MSEVPLYQKMGRAVRLLRASSLDYRGTSLIRNRLPLGPYSRTVPRALWGPQRGVRFLMNEVPLYQKMGRVARLPGASSLHSRPVPTPAEFDLICHIVDLVR